MVTMADTSTIDRKEWTHLFDRLSIEHEGELVTVEVLDPTVGHQHEAEALPFADATYDYKDDVVVVSVGGRSKEYPVVLRHMISHPAEINVVDDEHVGTAIRVVDPDGASTLVSFSPAAARS
jgi:uncharacterized protein DUF5335